MKRLKMVKLIQFMDLLKKNENRVFSKQNEEIVMITKKTLL